MSHYVVEPHALFDQLVEQLMTRMEITEAEDLLEIANHLLKTGKLVVYDGPKDHDYHLALAALALRLKCKGGRDLVFRAIAEGWDRARIVRELY